VNLTVRRKNSYRLGVRLPIPTWRDKPARHPTIGALQIRRDRSGESSKQMQSLSKSLPQAYSLNSISAISAMWTLDG
jgi:hypothetical protein